MAHAGKCCVSGTSRQATGCSLLAKHSASISMQCVLLSCSQLTPNPCCMLLCAPGCPHRLWRM